MISLWLYYYYYYYYYYYFAHLGGFLLELLDGALINTTALVDQVTGSGRFTGIDMANDNNVNVSFFFSHIVNR